MVLPPLVLILTSTKRPLAGTPVQSPQEVLNTLMSLNRATPPYRLIDGKSEGVDVIVEWRIVEAEWYEVFAKAGLSKTFRIYLRLDPAAHDVRAMDKEIKQPMQDAVTSSGWTDRGVAFGKL